MTATSSRQHRGCVHQDIYKVSHSKQTNEKITGNSVNIRRILQDQNLKTNCTSSQPWRRLLNFILLPLPREKPELVGCSRGCHWHHLRMKPTLEIRCSWELSIQASLVICENLQGCYLHWRLKSMVRGEKKDAREL